MADDNSSTLGSPPPQTSHPSHPPSDEPNSPYFLYHNDNVSTMVIIPPLTGSNYHSWNCCFTLAVFIKNKLGFLDDSISTPDFTNPIYIPWMRCNNLLLSWILDFISKEIASNVLYINLAKEAWDKLKAQFAQPDNVKIYHLQHQLGLIVQGTQSMSEYFTQLNAIWEQLYNYKPLPFCSCGHYTCNALRTVVEVQQLYYVFKFLMGYNDSFDDYYAFSE